MRNRFSGICYFCGKMVLPGRGHFEHSGGVSKVIHADCVLKQRTIKNKNRKDDK
ncbi:hypothetical protein [Proteiniclasticum sp.]|uniref:hypothetical protein n=1 Tax=Proteiniclasticum sp. TaxID=2053595 RepID=UPI0028980258|nr:hypothetical protein [Proteiniclasticum sp.]